MNYREYGQWPWEIRKETHNEVVFRITKLNPGQVRKSWTDHQIRLVNEHNSDTWYGASEEKVKDFLTVGAPEKVDKITALESQIVKKLGGHTVKRNQIKSAVYGGCVNVPAALISHPKAFFRRQPVSKPAIKVYIQMSYSAGIHQKDIQTNVVSYLTLAKQLTKSHNVEMFLLTGCMADYGENLHSKGDSGNCCIVIPLGLSPYDWSQMAGVTHVGVYRRWGISATIRMGEGTVASSGNFAVTNTRATFGAVLGIKETDLVFDGCELGRQDPGEWVQQQLEMIEERYK